MSYDIHVDSIDDKKTIQTLKNGGFLKTALKAEREYEVWAKTEAKSSVTIETKAGQTYCVKGKIGIGFIVGRPKLEMVDMATCQKEIQEANDSLEPVK